MNQRLLEIRKFFNLTQEELAERIGLTRSAIANMESGSRNIMERTVLDICREFGISKNWLLTGEEPMIEFKTEDEKMFSELGGVMSAANSEKKNLISAILSMSEDEVQTLKKLLNKFIK